MFLYGPRSLLLSVFLLDLLGQLLLLLTIVYFLGWSSPLTILFQFNHQKIWLIFCVFLYPLLSWLFGSYSVLQWRRISFHVLIQRLLITTTSNYIVVLIARWIFDPAPELWLVDIRFQFAWLSLLTTWSLLIRIVLHRGLLMPSTTRFILLSTEDEIESIIQAWTRIPTIQKLEPIRPADLECLLNNSVNSLLVALSPGAVQDASFFHLIKRLDVQDPRLVRTISLVSLFEQHQARPSSLLPESYFSYDDLPWAVPFSIQAQLKRLADLFVACSLLLFTAPLIGLAALLIWLEDRGPVFYSQERSGWLGRPFTVLKLRTMHVHTTNPSALWTLPGDQRITLVGSWLRRLRLDELPQLLNVLNGEMSLIGPRPERPELEHLLQRHLSHYRKRHWMRPGLSGWAQVCAPYASSIEDSDLKLSYDIYYMLNFSTWLDLVILFRTIKTVLKAGGR